MDELTERGRKLEPVIRELGRWGIELMPDTDPRLAFRSYWLEFPVGLYLTDRRPDAPPITIEVRVGEDPMVIETVDGEVRSHPGSVADPDVVLGGPAPALLGLVTGKLSLAGARNRGLRVEGDLEALGRVLPDPVAS